MKYNDYVTEAMLNEQGFYYITDFGFSKLYGKDQDRILVDSKNRIVITYNLNSDEKRAEVEKEQTPHQKSV